MKIDLTELNRGHWFEDLDGNVYDAVSMNLPKEKDYFSYTCVSPLTISDHVDSYTYHPSYLHQCNPFYQAMLCFKWFRNFMYWWMKKHPDRYHKTFKPLLTSNTHLSKKSGEIAVAMVNSGDYDLGEALYILSHCCERCSNVIYYKYTNGQDGYAEYSDEWKKCNTECSFCKNERRR